MKLEGTGDWLLEVFLAFFNPELQRVLGNSMHIKGQVLPHQAAALYAFAKGYNGGPLLEIGTFVGYTASLMAQAAPLARIITLNPTAHEVKEARVNLEYCPNVEVIQAKSWDYLKGYNGPFLDFIFVDGDHNRIARDLPWWDWVAKGGLMLFHDYSQVQCPPVFEGVNEFFDRDPDILIKDDDGNGLVGFYKGAANAS